MDFETNRSLIIPFWGDLPSGFTKSHFLSFKTSKTWKVAQNPNEQKGDWIVRAYKS